jgi:transcriptional regulator with XRE-family HTH domain
MHHMLTPTKCRMARAALGWNMKELAERSGVSANTIDRFENGRAAPIPANLKALRQAFEDAGVRFTETGVEPPEKDKA